jgi:polysaccharide biosynthesis/export protein
MHPDVPASSQISLTYVWTSPKISLRRINNMKTYLPVFSSVLGQATHHNRALVGCSRLLRSASRPLVLAVLLVAMGCQTPTTTLPQESTDQSGAFSLHEGDVVKISFPDTPALDTTQQIRRDGKIELSLVGEVQAAGYGPAELEQEILKLYASQLRSKQVNVTVVSSSFPVFVSGSVLRPGKVVSDRPLTVLQAIMEAGGFDHATANLKAVVVSRIENGQTRKYTINVQAVLEGKSTESFYLKPSDVVYVPEKFSWF